MTPKNVLRSKKLIKDAVLTLLCTKDPVDIKVTEITKLAEINRGTFYAHYDTVYDVIDEIEDDMIDKFILPFETTQNNLADYFISVKKMLEMGYSQRKEYPAPFNRIVFPHITQKLKDRIYILMAKSFPHSASPKKQLDYKIRISYLVSGFIGLMDDWTNGYLGSDITPDFMFSYIEELTLRTTDMTKEQKIKQV